MVTLQTATEGFKIHCKNLRMRYIQKQSGPIITIKAGTFSASQQEFKTRKYCHFRHNNNVKRHYGSSPHKLKNGELIIETKRLKANSPRVRIWYICPCGNAYYRQVGSAFRGQACIDCRAQKFKRKTAKELKEIKYKFGISFDDKDYKDNKTPIPYTKHCGCKDRLIINSLLTRNRVKICSHDAGTTWQAFQNLLQNSLENVRRPSDFPGFPDIITKNTVIELKLTKASIKRGKPRRSRKTPWDSIQSQRRWCTRNGYKFFVVVAEPQSRLGGFPEFVLGFERWGKARLKKELVQEIKKLLENPRAYLAKRPRLLKRTKKQQQRVNDVLSFCRRNKRMPTQRELLRMGTSGTSLANILFGNPQNNTKAALAKGLGLPKHFAKSIKIEYSNADLLKALKKAVNEIGHIPTNNELKKLGWAPSRGSYDSRFGGLLNAAVKAGFKIKHFSTRQKSVYLRLKRRKVAKST